MYEFHIHKRRCILPRWMIGEYLQGFAALYPDQFVPKHHYLVHLPRQIIDFGPLRNVWCMRYEGKHSYFKQLIGRSKSFKNVPKTLAVAHQEALCLQLVGNYNRADSSYLYAGDEYKGVTIVSNTDECYRHVAELLLHNGDQMLQLCRARRVVVGGCTYKAGVTVLRLNEDQNHLPRFGKVVDIVIHDATVFLLIAELTTETYCSLFHAYQVLPSQKNFIVDVASLVYPNTLHSVILNNQQFISMRDSTCIGLCV